MIDKEFLEIKESIYEKIFFLKKRLNKIDCKIEERKIDYEIRYPNSNTIDFRLFDLFEERKHLKKELLKLETTYNFFENWLQKQ